MDRDTLRGSLLMALAMAAFAVEDMIIKSVAGAMPTGQVLIFFGLGGMAIFAAMALAMAIEVWAGREGSEPQAAVSAIIGLRGFGGVEAKAVGRRLRTFLFEALDTNCHPPT